MAFSTLNGNLVVTIGNITITLNGLAAKPLNASHFILAEPEPTPEPTPTPETTPVPASTPSAVPPPGPFTTSDGTIGIDEVVSNVDAPYLPDNIENIPLTGEAHINVVLNALDNAALGNAGNNQMVGDGGHDTLFGDAGDDVIYGNLGTYEILGGDDQDQLFGGQGADLIYGNQGLDLAYGNREDDALFGGQGNDMVDGGSGNDVLHGNRGSDTLTSGSGGDQFHFSSNGGNDIVTDFNPDDGYRLVVSGEIINAQQTVDGNLLVTLESASITLIGVQLADWETQGASWLL